MMLARRSRRRHRLIVITARRCGQWSVQEGGGDNPRAGGMLGGTG
jgi:hypothetical protein